MVLPSCTLAHVHLCTLAQVYNAEYDVTDTSLVFGTGERVIRMKSLLYEAAALRRTIWSVGSSPYPVTD